MTERVWTLPKPSQPCGGVTDENSTQDEIKRDCLRLYNSLVDRKVPFIPATGPDSKVITWYTCGPTVYDVAHMGHARNYLAFDIVRRVLEDYFGYTILYVMNVTDVDDKIILRARRNYLLAMYLSENKGNVQQLLVDTKQAIAQAESKQLAKLAQMLESARITAESASTSASAAAKRKEAWDEREAQEKLLLSKILAAKKALEDMPLKDGDMSNEIIDTAGDYLAEWLDQSQGSSVTDPAIFRQHAAKYEAAFLEDMEILGVRPPTVMTRVSEYIPEIIHYVEKIVSQGFAYVASEGSVYFDTQAFRKAGHTYGKLNPWAVGAVDNNAAGDGNETSNENLKRHPSDFALWKAAKPGEPMWDSPWGAGRPGWHIECSAMASSIIGSTIDIHTGGEDLRFPHHDNELAQAEAFYHDQGCCQWVNYFLHSGHLGIEGLKMSKSLKNFITIREALNSFTPRQLRLMMVLTPWDRRMAFGEQVKEEMKAREAQIRNFFANIDVGLRRAGGPKVPQKWSSEELTLSRAITLAASVVHERLLDSIDTRGAMDALSELIKATNIYLAARADGSGGTSRPQAFLLEQCSSFVSRILSVFGLASLGKPSSGELNSKNSKESNSDALVSGVLEAFCSFRDKVRQLARSSDAGFADAKKLLLHSCDCVRDETMVKLGVRLEDTPDGGSVWKMDDPATLQAEVDAKRAAQSEALARKLKSKLDSLVRDVEKFEKLAALPSIQESLKDKYSKFDQVSGDPTHDAEGVVLQGKPLEKAKKDVEKAKKVRAPLEKRVAEEGVEFMDNMRQEIKSIQDQLNRLQVE